MAQTEKKTATTDKKPLTKTQIIAAISDATSLSKKDVGAVLDALGNEIAKSIGKKGVGSFTLPGLLKIEKKHVEKVPAKKHIENPLRPGEFYDRAAKPAHDRIKVKALKGLKDMVKEGK